MSYKNINLLEIIRKIESHQICLPSIQRKFEWKPDRIEKLFDSILNDYPIGTFLIWEIQQKKVSKFRFYEINNDYDLTEGKWQKQRTQATALTELWALLDGQQRLTSIIIGLQGSYTHSPRGKKVKRKLYFSLFERPDEEDYRSFRFFADGDHLKDKNNIWIPASLFVNELAAFHNDRLPMDIEIYSHIKKYFTDCIEQKSEDIKAVIDGWTTKNEYLKIGNRIHQFALKIAKPDAFSYYLINNNINLDTCNEIFVRINSGGVKLSKADLLFSTVVSEWETGREKIDQLIKEVKKIGFEIDSDFVMRTCLYLTYNTILFKVDTFSDDAIEKIISSFNTTNEKIGIYDTIINTFKFLKMKLGLADKMLKSKNVLIPVIHHLFHGGKLGDESVEEVQKFIYISLLQKTFGSHGDTLLDDLRKGVSEENIFQLKNAAFSYKRIISKISEATKQYLYNVNLAWAEKLLTTKYGSDAWLILSLIFGNLRYEYQSYDQDHLHPKSKFTNENYQGDLNAIKDKIDAIPNLTFSTPDDNRLNKKAHSLKAYVEDILPVRNPEWQTQYRTFNKIDENISLELSDFTVFFAARRRKLLDILVDKLQLDPNSPVFALNNDSEKDFNDEVDDEIEIESDADFVEDQQLRQIDEDVNEPVDDYIDEHDEEMEPELAVPIGEGQREQRVVEINEHELRQRPQGFNEVENDRVRQLYDNLIQTQLNFIPPGSYDTRQIYLAIQEMYPELCNDNYLCINNCNSGHNNPEWKHAVRRVLNRLKTIHVLQYDSVNKLYIR